MSSHPINQGNLETMDNGIVEICIYPYCLHRYMQSPVLCPLTDGFIGVKYAEKLFSDDTAPLKVPVMVTIEFPNNEYFQFIITTYLYAMITWPGDIYIQ